MKYGPLALVALFLSCVVASADPPKRVEDKPIVNPLDPVVIDGPIVTEVELTAPAKWTELTGKTGVLKKLSSSTAANWLLIDDKFATLDQSADGKTATFTTPVAGRFQIVVIGDNRKGARVAVTVADGPTPPPIPVPPGPGPGPGPGPDPKPPVPPAPAGKVAKFVVVEDTSKSGQWRGDVLGSPALANFIKNTGIKWQLIDVQAPEGADAESAAFIAKAAGKKLPQMWMFDADKKQIGTSIDAPIKPDEFLAVLGNEAPHKRAMGNNPPNKVRYQFKQFGAAPNVPLIKRENWKAVDLSAFLPDVYDQDGRGQCNASATCTAMEACRNQAGLIPVKLSAGDLYSRINGGRDQGSTLEDGLAEAMSGGVATAKTVPYIWDGRTYNTPTVKGERGKYVVLEAYQCQDFDAMASALQQGFFIIEGLMWFDNDNIDRDGWIPARGSGGSGGHALCGFGLIQRNGVWGIRTRNSWSAAWGNGGNCTIPEQRFGQQIGGFWAVRAMRQTGTDFPVSPSAMMPKAKNPFERYDEGLAAYVLKP